MFDFPLTKRYSSGDVTFFLIECARKYGEQVQQCVIEKDKVFDACIVDFINHQEWAGVGMKSSAIYSDEWAPFKSYYQCVSDEDIVKIAVMAKYKYLKYVSEDESLESGSLSESVNTNPHHYHEDLTGEKITNEIVENNIDKFLIFVGRLRGIKITPVALKLASDFFKFEQSKPFEEPSTSSMS